MRSRPFNAQFIVGLVVIALGVIFVLDNLDIVYARDYLRYWPAFLIILGLAKLTDRHTNKFWPSVLVGVGSLLLLDRMDILDFHVWDWWPLILILLGGTILWGSLNRHRSQTAILTGSEGTDDDSVLRLTAFLGGFERKLTSSDFRGGNITLVMGGCELDLTQATIKGDEAVLDIFTFMGGAEIRIPETWRVVMKGLPIMGGFSDETRPPLGPNAKRLILQGNVIMGGVEVKN